jgi:biopolymer transport protein ExbD
MKIPTITTSLVLLLGCDSPLPSPGIVRNAGLNYSTHVDHAGPVDPDSILYTIHADGRISWKGKDQTAADLKARMPHASTDEINRTPILLEVDPKASFSVVRDALAILVVQLRCVNLSFLVATPKGPGAVALPIKADRGMGYLLCEGRSGEWRVGGSELTKRLEIMVSTGERGGIVVTALNHVVPRSVYVSEAGNPAKPPAWQGNHPRLGPWSKPELQTFLARSEVLNASPYILFSITNKESTADVVRCLSVLRSLGEVPVIPEVLNK